MPQRDEEKVQVPYFGSANQDNTANNIVEKQQLAKKQYESQGSHWIHTLLILLLIGSVGAMAYWGYDFKQDQQQRELLAEATESRIAELEQLLADSTAEAEKSGQTLKQRLDEQKKLVIGQKELMETQYREYETKFSELIKSADAKQAEQLAAFNFEIEMLEQKVKNAQEDAQEEMGFMTSQQKTALSGLEDRLAEMDALRTNVTNLEITQTKQHSVQQGLVEDIKVLNKDLLASTEKLNSTVLDLTKETGVVDTHLDDYKVAVRKALRSLSSKIAVVAKKVRPKVGSSLNKRVSQTESAIKAIDGSRALVNKEIQRLKSKVNKIQLQLQ
ncbi:MAG: hypothetical protein OFPII_07370 [Osedax symbiont Rs1]|nr:MAG: hypothetical protein OFPII_07370 [Osedax symbiont Rs1]